MTLSKLIDVANSSGGTLYLMALLLLIELTVIIERLRHLSHMQQGGDGLIEMLQAQTRIRPETLEAAVQLHPELPHTRLFHQSLVESPDTDIERVEGHLEEVLMHEAPALDRSLWVLDTVITLAPLLGLFGTIIGMFGAFSVLGDVQNGPGQVTGGIAEALIATASGLLIAMVGLVFFNLLNTKVRVIVHQMETIKVMLVNRRFGIGNGGEQRRGAPLSLAHDGTQHGKA